MNITLKNSRFEAVISSRGAEINALRSVSDGTEYIWNGDASVWKYHAPILFPHVGRIRDGYAVIEGQRCEFGVNGFARDQEHTLVSSTDTSAVWELTENSETLVKYPYKFKLTAKYELTDSGITFTTTVTNTDSREISFALGSHSAFCCPRNTDAAGTVNSDYQIEFEKREALTAVCCTADGYLEADEDEIAPCSKPYGEKEAGIIPLTAQGFGNGHFFTAFNSDWVGLRNKKTGSLVTVNTKNYPYCMIWQNAGDPKFVCIEPWYGTPDPAVTDHEWSNKPALVELVPGTSFTADQSITIR